MQQQIATSGRMRSKIPYLAQHNVEELHVVIVGGLNLANQLDSYLHSNAIIPWRHQLLRLIVLREPGRGEHHSAVEDHLGQLVLVSIQHSLPHSSVLHRRRHVHPVLKEPPSGL